ncbi:MAG: 2-oxoacid:acceptor oxidoreductase family protein [Jatrophihabitans sp.]|uniref:2-oxoacid:acceptor oxidoreductase family protein n=1 Tax=Jatrophihabitans sp. TaxID=1932789 RepID=UPI003F7EBA98
MTAADRKTSYDVRLHGRGGQGVVTAAVMLSMAAFRQGRWAQAFPLFGAERMGAPIMAFCRIGDEPIRAREPVTAPDAVVVADAGLVHTVDVTEGLVPGGLLLVNSARTPADLLSDRVRATQARVVCVDAAGIARRHLGRPLPNIALLGAFAALTGVIGLPALDDAVRSRFAGDLVAANIAAAADAYDAVGARVDA